MEGEVGTCRRQADASRAILQVYRVQRLPPELLAEIFIHYLGATVLAEATVLADPYCPNLPSPLLLGHICSAWRQVSHGTPKLWTILPICIRRQNVDYVTITRAWIRRAHPFLLCVSLGSSIGTISDRMMTAILQSADRIQSFGLFIPSFNFQPSPAVRPMTSLETLHLSAKQCMRFTIHTVLPMTMFMTAPRLRRVTLLDYHNFMIIIPQMPWSQLTYLEITGCFGNKCLDALSQCANLIEGTFAVFLPIDDFPPIILPRLRKLDITIRGPGSLGSFFQPLSLPSLKYLDLDVEDDAVWAQQDFVEFTQRSSLELEHLSLPPYIDISPVDLLELLAHVPSLLRLKFGGYVDDFLIDGLRHRTGTHYLVPKLEELFIESSVPGVTSNCIADMIESRWRTDEALGRLSSLKKVSLQLHSMARDSRLRELQSIGRMNHFQQEGLSFDLKYQFEQVFFLRSWPQ